MYGAEGRGGAATGGSADAGTAGRAAEAVVDLEAVAHNTRLMKQHTDSALMAIVKADGYGHGAVQVARTALDHGASWIGVTFTSEALALRAAGLDAPVLAWMHLPQEDLADALRARVDLSASACAHLDQIAEAAERAGAPAAVHLKVDTGLQRNGASPQEWPALLEAAARRQAEGLIRVRGIWSHLVHPHDPGHPTTDLQADAFDRAVAAAAEYGVRAELLHLANSGATLGAARTHYDLVRVGSGLYGIEPINGRRSGVRRAMTLRARVIAARHVPGGVSASYGHSYTTSQDTTFALVPVGYAHGLPRAASGNAELALAGVRKPITGLITMDQTVVDAGAGQAAVGDEAVLFGPGDNGEPTAADWASWAATNEHEVLIAVGSRVPRTYLPATAGPPVSAPADAPAATWAWNSRRLRVAVLFGGPGGEHEVSCQSGAGIVSNLDRAHYSVQPVRITPDGRWTAGPADLPAGQYAPADLIAATPVGGGPVEAAVVQAAAILADVDFVVPALHGRFGEDGTVQALMDVLGVPYLGSGIAASATGMDKDLTKRILAASGLPVGQWAVLRRGKDELSEADRERLGLPVFVKPARSGSSVGVTRVTDWAELEPALAAAREWDAKVLVESGIAGREVDVAVLEHADGRLEAGPPIEISVRGGQPYFDYDAKYRDMSTEFTVPAKIDPAIAAELQRHAVAAFEILGCSGLARVDFFLRGGTEPVFNEINTFPGFTAGSQYPRIWRSAGVPLPELLDRLIDTALAKHRAGVAAP